MRFAVACDGLTIAPQFVLCTNYACYTVANDTVIDSRNIAASDQPLDKLPDFFHAIEADVLVTGSIDHSLADTLEANGIHVIADKKGDPLTAVRASLVTVSGC